ncbi:MAG: phage tail protein [Streptosporangiaceae bacterium]
MSAPFLGEIKVISFNFPPKGWAFCNGALLQISQNQPLWSVLGTTYGGDGRITFGLPNLQGRTPMHVGNGIVLGEMGGETTHTLNISEVTTHNHQANGTNTTGDSPIPASNYLGGAANFYAPLANTTSINPATVGGVGSSQSHENMAPYLVLNFIIALQGIFPSQS